MNLCNCLSVNGTDVPSLTLTVLQVTEHRSEGFKRAICRLLIQMMVSGGVDSTVCAALLHRALQPEQVIALHVDNGFMRQDESKKVEESLRALGLHLSGLLFFVLSSRCNLQLFLKLDNSFFTICSIILHSALWLRKSGPTLL